MMGLRVSENFMKMNKKEQSLSDILWYVDFIEKEDPGAVVMLKDGSLMSIFEIKGFEYEGIFKEEIAQVNDSVKRYFELLPGKVEVANIFIRKKAEVKEIGIFDEKGPQIARFIYEKKKSYWKNEIGEIYKNKIYLSITYHDRISIKTKAKDMMRRNRIFSILKSKIETNLKKLKNVNSDALVSLKGIGIKMLKREDVFKILYQLINDSKAPKYRNDLTLNSQLAGSKMKFYRNYLRLNDEKYVSMIAIRDLPAETKDLMFKELWGFCGEINIIQGFRVAKKEILEKNIRRGQRINSSMVLRKTSLLNEISEADDYLEKIDVEKQVPVVYTIYIKNIAKNFEELKEKNRELKNILSTYGAKGFIEDFYLPGAYFSMIPGHIFLNERNYKILSENAGELFQKFSLDSGDKNSVDFFIDSNKGIFNFSPFSKRENANHIAVTGSTGTGKSFFVTKMLLSSLILDPYILVVDNSKAMMGFFEILKGEKPKETVILGKNEFKFNPFEIDENKEVSEEQIEYTIGLLRLMIGNENIKKSEITILSEAVKQFYKEYAQFKLNGMEFKEGDGPLNILYSIIKNKFKNETVALSIKEWLSGQKGRIVNNSRDEIKNSKYMYFNIEEMEDNEEIYSVLMYIIFNKVKELVSDKKILTKKKIFVLEEVYKNLKKPEFSQWVDFYIRTGRKKNLTLCLITQNIEDLVEIDKFGILKEWSKGVVNNLYQLVMFKGNRNIDVVFDKFKLNENHKKMYKKLGNGGKREFFYWSASGIRRILKNIADPYTYFIATDNPVEKILREKLKENIGLKGAVEKLVEITKGVAESEEREKICKEYMEDLRKKIS